MPQHQPRVRRAASTETSFIPARPDPAPGLADNSPRALHSFGQIALTPPLVQRCACQENQDQDAAQNVQFKLTVNTPGDSYEQEADATADQVLRMSAPTEGTQIQRCAACEEEARRTELQRKETSQDAGGEDLATADVSSIVAGGLASGGRPLDPATRAFMEPRFGHDFSQVRVHDNPQASSSAQSVAARAYTLGSNIAFRSGEFAPGSGEGRRLLAHELTHVVQQGAATPLAPGVQRSLWVSQMTGLDVQRDDDDPQDGGTSSTDPNAPNMSSAPDPASADAASASSATPLVDTSANSQNVAGSAASVTGADGGSEAGLTNSAPTDSSGTSSATNALQASSLNTNDPTAGTADLESCQAKIDEDTNDCTDQVNKACSIKGAAEAVGGGLLGGTIGMLGGPVGAGIGAAIGGVAGGVYGAMDYGDCCIKQNKDCRSAGRAAKQKCASKFAG